MFMNIDVLNSRIQFKELYKTNEIDNKYFFFYDESGNIRKLHIEKSKTNAPLCDYFVLGGLVLDYIQNDSENIKKEFNEFLSLPQNELKSSFICTKSNDFMQTLKQKKLHEFLRFCLEKDFHIHFKAFNLLYWSIVDIIDSIEHNSFEIENRNILKNLIYLVCKENIVEISNLFEKYDYPDVKKEKQKKFLDELIHLVTITKQLCHREKSFLIAFLSKGYNKKLIFISNDEKGVLVENFLNQYMNNVEKYINSVHCFDEEKHIQKLIHDYDYIIMNDNQRINNYLFCNSQSNFYLQLSDVIVGIIHRFKLYLLKRDMEDIEKDLILLTNFQKENLQMLLMLIKKSEQKSKFFIHNIDAMDEINKLACLFRIFKGSLS